MQQISAEGIQDKHEWVGKVIYWEMCKKLKFDHTNKWYMHNPAPVLENNTRKFVDFAVPADHRIKLKECEKKDKYLDFAGKFKKLWNVRMTIVPIVIGA